MWTGIWNDSVYTCIFTWFNPAKYLPQIIQNVMFQSVHKELELRASCTTYTFFHARVMMNHVTCLCLLFTQFFDIPIKRRVFLKCAYCMIWNDYTGCSALKKAKLVVFQLFLKHLNYAHPVQHIFFSYKSNGQSRYLPALLAFY